MAEDFKVKVKFMPEFAGAGLGSGSPQSGANVKDKDSADTARVMRGLVKPVMSLLLTGRLGLNPTNLLSVLSNPAMWKVGALAMAPVIGFAIGQKIRETQNDLTNKFLGIKENAQKFDPATGGITGQAEPKQMIFDRVNRQTIGKQGMVNLTDRKEMEKLGITYEDLADAADYYGLQISAVDDVIRIFQLSLETTDDTAQQVISNIERFGQVSMDMGEIVSTVNTTISKTAEYHQDNAVAIENETKAMQRQISVQKDLQNVLNKASARGQTISSSGISGGGRDTIGFSEGFSALYSKVLRESNAG